MSQNYSGRISLILFVLLAALVAIFWPSLANPSGVAFNGNVPLSQKLNLKPGIDIVGGTSLLYEIKVPEGGSPSPTLAEDVTKALKKRVDPNGVLNLIWRPQNPNKLEIQMPLSGASSENARRTKALEDAGAQLEATNVRISEAMVWVERGGEPAASATTAPATAPTTAPSAAPRSIAKLDELSKGSSARRQILLDLAAAYDAIRQADAAIAAARQVSREHTEKTGEPATAEMLAAASKAREDREAADRKFNSLQDDLTATNRSLAELSRLVSLKSDAQRKERLAAIKTADAAYAQRIAALDAYVSAADAIAKAGGGLESATDLKRLLRGSGLLEFHILPDLSAQELTDAQHPGGYQDWVVQLQKFGPRGAPGDNYRWFEVDNPEEFKGGGRMVPYDGRQWVLASVRSTDSLDRESGDWKLVDARPEVDPQSGGRAVRFGFDRLGGQLFGTLTSRHVNKAMAIMLDGRLISAPNINSAITGGTGTITGGGKGGFAPKELEYLVSMLSAGSLPAQLDDEPIFERTVGPQLGEDNLRSGLIACSLGLVIVAIFLVSYYYLAGLVAFIGVLMNLVILLGAMAAINATFTLPGIAAIILTVGGAVDSNVLIFERLREEQHRGLPIRMALRNAYDRAFSAILDSNMTTLITSFFLIMFGTEEVKGFGITLIIGIVASLFTSLYVSRTIFGVLIDKFGVKKLGSLPLSIPKWDEMLRPNIRWTKLVPPFAIFSVVFIVAGCILFGVYAGRGQVMDIEFAGGTAVTFETTEAKDQSTVRGWMADQEKKNPLGLPAPQVVRVGTDGRTWEVTTASTDAIKVREAVLSAVGNNLKADLPSKFLGLGQSIEKVPFASRTWTEAASQPTTPIVIPITPDNLLERSKTVWPGGAIPEQARQYVGGAAIVLRQLDPPIKASEIASRINRQKLQVHTGGSNMTVTSDFTVVGVGGSDQPVREAILLTSEQNVDARKDEAKWRANLVSPLWELAQVAVSSPPQLQQVKNVNASVAGDTKKDATIALIASLVFIMAYIWVRFGNLKYGTATVFALIHDVLFCFAALGFAHLLSGNALGEALQLQPFRINLTLIAAILTIMGYSMLDTIVVFDRIREIRGKYGHVSATVINDAVNQTLSRTLLTAGTTIISVAIMYFIGGEGIHGFTFVLFVGILAGTYSSIAIASPILLVGSKAEDAPAKARGTATVTT
ncbi:protein translocase subunit SecD [Humisphaera borealis]|uniref:Multifunctional fusion protein n=1 Tax=Humisphaera borealis TaxID=2807512 RepID=A0A7M2X2A4_9BACT|nr:protein translocase subunit SecD [Humisphaera borealis]QOV91739.1 protein translocase subunit SecD [Humisphaera borealis]